MKAFVFENNKLREIELEAEARYLCIPNEEGYPEYWPGHLCILGHDYDKQYRQVSKFVVVYAHDRVVFKDMQPILKANFEYLVKNCQVTKFL